MSTGPKASEGGREQRRNSYLLDPPVKGFDLHVTPVEVIDRGAGKIDVRVHQLVKSLNGDVLSDREVWHFYTTADTLIERMDLEESGADSEQSPSSAFSHR